MNQAYRRYAETGESNSLVKTFLIEYDRGAPGGAMSKEMVCSALTIPATSKTGMPWVPDVIQTEETGFFVATWGGLDGVRIFIDSAAESDGRFWTCYSLSDADRLDLYFDRLAYLQPKLDRIWLWPAMLSSIQELGEFRGVGIDYDKRRIEKRLDGRDSANYFKFQIWGGPETKHFLQIAQHHGDFRQQAVLSKIRMKYGASEGAEGFTLEDIKYNGKFTARGTDIYAHQHLVSEVRTRYKAKIAEIEDRHAISHAIEGTSYGVKGEPVFFNLSSCPIENLDAFSDVVFSGGPPFHLWGLVDTLGSKDTGRVVHAVDMHTGSKLFFEVYPDIVTMYLYAGGCGNTVVRFFINLQRMFGAMIRGEDNDSRDIFV
jgi:hypothetical protein